MAWSSARAVSLLPALATALAGVALGVGSLAGCAAQREASILPDPDGGFVELPTTYAADIAPIIAKVGCFGCHMTNTFDGVEELTTSAAIVTYWTTHHPEECPSTQYIVAGEPARSYIYQKVTGQGDCFTGAPMPFGNGPLPTSESAVFRDWIMNGALIE